jgi:thymidylate synthase (FAD)
MEIIEPNVEYWKQGDDVNAHIARCARVCYASLKTTNNDNFVDSLIHNKHLSMLRHATCYYVIAVPKKEYAAIRMILRAYKHCPYIEYDIINGVIYISANRQFIFEHLDLNNFIHYYEVSEDMFFYKCPNKDLFRFTFCVTTQISTSRELNRVSPNNIAEQSTRYINFGKKGGIKICKPFWYDTLTKFDKWKCRVYWWLSEKLYNAFLYRGLKPQDVREFLPLCAATKCIYTYTLKEWKHILDLRYYGTTGTPHPNAKLIAGMINDKLKSLGYE